MPFLLAKGEVAYLIGADKGARMEASGRAAATRQQLSATGTTGTETWESLQPKCHAASARVTDELSSRDGTWNSSPPSAECA